MIETVCWDGKQNWTEQCDDWNTKDGDWCDSSCMIETVCWNGQ
jgi:cysteine-rich repeat protein